QPPQPPEAGARAVFVHRLDVHVALPRPGLGTEHVGQERLRGGVAVQDVALAALLVIDHELHGDSRAVRPARIGRIAAIADKIAGIAGAGGRGHAWSYTDSTDACLGARRRPRRCGSPTDMKATAAAAELTGQPRH